MDREYPPDRETARPGINGPPPNVEDCRDAKTIHDSGYSARWRDDRQPEKSRIMSYEHARSVNANPKDDKRYHSSPLAAAEPGMTEELLSDVPSKPSIILTSNEAPKSANYTIAPPPTFETIRQLLTPVSEKDKIQSIEIEVCWDVGGFLFEELEGRRNVAPVLTLSGTVEKAFAATCEDYIRYVWSEFGLGVLERLFPTAQTSGSTEGTVSSDTKLEGLHLEIASLKPYESCSAVFLRATGLTESLIKLAQILTWIAATFRRPKYGQLSYSTPTFFKIGDVYVIGTLDLEPIKDGLCWCPMFANGVIAKYFPTPKRHDEVGLEISFDLMVILGRIWYPMEYLNGFVLKGYSTILVPTRNTGNSVQWHFIHNEDQKKKIKMSAIKAYCEKFVEDINLQALQTARTFVGWTSHAYVHAGAKTSGYDSIRDSKVPCSPRRPRLAREMTSGIGTSGLGFFGMQLGTKVVIPKSVFGPVKREHILLEDMLLNSRNNPLLLWDSGSRRAWMVSEIAVLLMILHVWAARQTDSETLLKKIPFAERSSDDAQASYEAIRKN